MPIKRIAHPKISSSIGRLDRSSRLGTLPRAKLKDRYTQVAASNGVSVRNPLAKIFFPKTSIEG
jgi:hypothetical protein